MGKKLQINEKAAAARERKIQIAEQAKSQAEKALEDSKWTDEGSTIKEKRAKEKLLKDQEKAAAAAKKKALVEAEEAMMSSMKMNHNAKQNLRKVGELPSQRVTQYELSKHREAEEEQRKAKELEVKLAQEKLIVRDFLVENTNRIQSEEFSQDVAKYGAGNVLHARDIDTAIKTLSINSFSGADLAKDRRPEKRQKAAYKAFEAERIPELRADYPELKLSQIKERVFKEWDKSPLNPMNQKD